MALFKVLLLFLVFTSKQVLADAKFKVGVLIPLSGMASEFGTAIRNGASLAIEDNQSKAGNCEFIYEDTQYDATKAVNAFQKLANDGVNLVYQFYGEYAVAPIAEMKGVPVLCDAVDPKVSEGRKFIIRNQNSSYEFVAPVSDFLGSKGKKKLVVVESVSPYLSLMVDNFILSSKGKFDSVERIPVQAGESDFKPYLTKLLKGDHDAVGLFLFPGQLNSIGRLFKGREKKYLFFGADFLQTGKEIESSQGVLEGSYFPNNIVTEEYYKRYTDKFHNDSQMKFAGEGYDVMNLIISNFCSLGKLPTNEEVLSIIKNIKVRKGVLGDSPYIETAEGDKYFKSPVYMMKASASGASVVK
jgi:branched-chain amino acid transport system substrate-binding protein